MEIITIFQKNHDILKHKAKTVTFPLSIEVKNFIDEMKNFIINLPSPYGKPAGLAAPQLGKSLRIIFIQVPEEAKKARKNVLQTMPLTLLINPTYTPISEKVDSKDWEACYSAPDLMGEVWRYNEINYNYYDIEGNLIKNKAKGFLARLIQHEIDHLNGRLYLDLIQEDCRLGPLEAMMEIRKKELENE